MWCSSRDAAFTAITIIFRLSNTPPSNNVCSEFASSYMSFYGLVSRLVRTYTVCWSPCYLAKLSTVVLLIQMFCVCVRPNFNRPAIFSAVTLLRKCKMHMLNIFVVAEAVDVVLLPHAVASSGNGYCCHRLEEQQLVELMTRERMKSRKAPHN